MRRPSSAVNPSFSSPGSEKSARASGLAMDAFADEYVAVDRRTLTGYDVRATGGYEAFIASGVWRDGRVRQIEFVVGRPAPLAEPAAWDRRERELESPSPGR